MKKNKAEILDPEVDDFCAILAEALRQQATQKNDAKKRRAKARHTGSSRPPPDEGSPSAIG